MKVSKLAVFSLMLIAPLAISQQRGNRDTLPPNMRPPGVPDINSSDPGRGGDYNPFERSMETQRAKLREEERQKRLVDDTAKLLDLANQLKVEVDKAGRNTLSISVIKKTEEIEKLAKSVRDRMKG